MKRLKGILGVILIWFFGVICGLVISTGAATAKFISIVEGGPEKMVDVVVDRLRKELKLDHDQLEMVKHIALDTRIKLRAIRQKTEPEVDATLEESAERVRGVLNPDQVRHFDEIVRKGREIWRGGEKLPAKGPGQEAEKKAGEAAPPKPATPPTESTPTPSASPAPAEAPPAASKNGEAPLSPSDSVPK